MTVDETSVNIVGYQDEYTSYTLRIEEIEYNGDEATVTGAIRRDGDSAIVEDAEVTVTVGGEETSYDGSFPDAGADGVWSEDQLTVPADGGDTIEIEWVAVNWENESGTLSGEIPVPDISTSVDISPTEIYTDETIDVEIEATNDGSADGEVDVAVDVDDEEVESTTLSVAAGDSTSETYELDFSSDGDYTVAVETGSDGTTSETVTVLLPMPDVSVADCSISDERVQVGEAVTLSATVENAARGGDFVATLSDQDGEIERETFEIDTTGSRDIEFEVVYDTANTDGYDLSVDALTPGFYAVEITEARIA